MGVLREVVEADLPVFYEHQRDREAAGMAAFPPRERAFAASLFNSGTNVAPLIAPAIVPWIALHYGWQMCFIVAGSAGFLWLALWLPLYKNNPGDSRHVSPAERDLIDSDRQPAPTGEPIGWLQLFTFRQTWAIVLAKFLTDPVWWFFLIWLPDFFKKTRGLDLKNSWVHLVGIYAIATVLSLAGGWLSGRLIRNGWTVTRARKTAMAIFSLCVIPVVFAPQTNEWLAVFLIGLAGAAHDVFVRRQLLEPHRAAGVKLVGADADLGPKAELVAVVEARRGVPEHDGAVHPGEELLRRGGVGRDDRVGVVRAVRLDVLDGGSGIVHDLHRENQVEELGAVVRLHGGLDES